MLVEQGRSKRVTIQLLSNYFILGGWDLFLPHRESTPLTSAAVPDHTKASWVLQGLVLCWFHALIQQLLVQESCTGSLLIQALLVMQKGWLKEDTNTGLAKLINSPWISAGENTSMHHKTGWAISLNISTPVSVRKWHLSTFPTSSFLHPHSVALWTVIFRSHVTEHRPGPVLSQVGEFPHHPFKMLFYSYSYFPLYCNYILATSIMRYCY